MILITTVVATGAEVERKCVPPELENGVVRMEIWGLGDSFTSHFR